MTTYLLFVQREYCGMVYDDHVATVHGAKALQVARQMFPAASVEPVLSVKALKSKPWKIIRGKNERQHI